MNPLPNYPGSKGGSGVDKLLVSLMPPHRVYVEGFLGGGALLRLKRPAALSIGLDHDASVIAAWGPAATPGLTLKACIVLEPSPRKVVRAHNGTGDDATSRPRLCIAQADFLHLVSSPPALLQDPSTLIYLDPPYLHETRTRLIYACEMHDPLRHAVLLAAIQDLRCMVMVSHYPCRLYDETLKSWRRIDYRCMTRGGPRAECCWVNFPEPATLHDARFAGQGYRERERIKRKKLRWVKRFAAMPDAERQVIREALEECG